MHSSSEISLPSRNLGGINCGCKHRHQAMASDHRILIIEQGQPSADSAPAGLVNITDSSMEDEAEISQHSDMHQLSAKPYGINH
ncbi:hypothetical protein V6N12_030358 [Hibiscus sabdariffa]|uniref:Uncharacterized protein n=1 Tax=Hibiscus sabdariffa TaxID=183260 RepID=A0ABR2C277_9ROSI